MSRCDLFLDNYATCYYAGQQIVGRLRCYFNSPKSTSGIFVKIKGMALVEWSESHTRKGANNKSETVRVHYRGVHELINDKLNLLYQHGNKIDVPAGEHVYPFTYTLPPDLPSTFNTSQIGKITYIIKGNVDLSFQFDYKAEAEINIVEVFDLNRCPNLLMPVNVNKQKSLCCLCLSSGPIDMSLHIPYTGFVPGQSVPITLSIENLSRTTISGVTFTIYQKITFYSTTPHRKSRIEAKKITETKDTGVGAHGERTYDLHLQIPSSFTPLNMKICSVIDVTYMVNVEVVIPGMHRNIKHSVDIEVGNIALVDSGYRVQQYPPVQSTVEQDVDIVGELDGFAVIGPNTNPSAPPPPMQPSLVLPTLPSAPTPQQGHSGIGWFNPSSDNTKPPAYNDLFKE